MSLNGLDDPVVQEAYQAAVAEAGGWLLLKYTSRDSVDLFSRGKGGIQEARANIAKYDETSPLYGMVVYRRRKVLIKYIPEGTSRLLQARTAVHFQDVVEKFSPYETLLEITSSEGLSDSSLAASFPLHTATPSASSSRLDEISEDAEDSGPAKAAPPTPTGSYFASQRHRLDRQRTLASQSPTKSLDSTNDANRPASPASYASPVKTSVSQFLFRSDSGQPSITSLGTTSMTSMAEYTASEASGKDAESSVDVSEPALGTSASTTPAPSEVTMREFEPAFPEVPERTSSRGNSSRKLAADGRQSNELSPSIRDTTPSPSISKFSEQLSYEDDLPDFLKPKVKLGPRPVAAGEKAKRPTVATISSMPAGYRPFVKRQEAPRPTLRSPATAPPTISKTLPTPPPIPDTPEYKPRPLSRGSVKSMPSHKSAAMTPDKIRLMKAVELRKKQMRKSNPQAESFAPPTSAEVPDVPKVPEQPSVQEDGTSLGRETEATVSNDVASIPLDEPLAPAPVSNHKADSGIQMDYQKGEKLDAAATDDEPDVEEPKEVVAEPTESAPEQDLRLTRESSPQLNIPGSYLSVSTPESEVEPVLDVSSNANADNALETDPAEDSVAVSTVAEPASTDSLQEEASTLPKIVMADGSRPITSNGPQTTSAETKSIESDPEVRSFYDSASNSGDLDDFEMSPKRKNSDLARRRQGFVEPIHIDTDPDITTDDDDLMEELQSATLEEATPVMVSRSSPVQEYFPRRPSAGVSESTSGLREIRIPPSPSGTYENVGDASPRTGTIDEFSVPRSRADFGDRNDLPAGTKRNVSSEISKRIQALAGMSSPENVLPTPEPLSNDRDNVPSLRSAPHSRNSSWKAVSRYSARMGTYQNPTGGTPPSQASSGPVYTVQRNSTSNRESVSVSARIVRPSISEETEPQNNTDTDFHESKYVVSHKRGMPSRTIQPPPLQPVDTNSDLSTSQRESPSPKPTSPTLTRVSKDSHRISHNTVHSKAAPSPTADDFPQPPPNNRTISATSFTSNDENAAPKEGTRTSRFFKRMSNIGGKRRSGAQQGSETNLAALIANAPSKETVAMSSMPPAVVVGDLNIQFPDSLLWKRRIVTISDDGHIKFSIPQATETQKASSTRKFALSEFRMPFIPDLDRQELSHSIMLDFIDGGTTLQVACEDAMTHAQVAQVLKAYWKAWTSSARGE